MTPSDQEEITLVEISRIFCDGGNGALGHPGVYLNLGDDGTVACPYCSRTFQLDPDAPAETGH
ncbi:MAG: zinc-finger domain-containing protein [Rhodospirillaceae bacterium]|jgi:uncharacterized Zn-finger protein